MDSDDRFAELIAPVRSRMFQTVWKILRHSQDAEDALQIALTTIWRQRSRIASHPAPQALMLRICADTAIDHYRRRRCEKFETVDLAEAVPASRPLPVDAAIGNETLALLLEAIARLSPHQATAIVMRFIQGESDAGIAAALGCATETVREHLERGRERLGHMLGRLNPRTEIPATSTTADLHAENRS